MNPVLVEGWFGVPHSYALVLENIVKQWLRDPRKELLFRPLPFRGTQAPIADADLRSAIEARRWRGEKVQAVFRLCFPFDISRPPSEGAKVIVGMTAEADVPCSAPSLPAGGEALRRATEEGALIPLAPSAWSAELIRRAGAARVEVIPYGVDTELFRPTRRGARPFARIPFGDDRFVFLSVGAMTSNKGIDALVRAFVRVHAEEPRAALVLKGLDGLYRSSELVERSLSRILPTQAAAKSGARPASLSIHLLGATLSELEMAELYATSDAYVAPYSAEGFCLPALEAFASGIPVIASAGGPTDEFLDDGLNVALRVKTRRMLSPLAAWLQVDENDLVDKMRSALVNEGLRDRAASVGPAFCKGRCGWSLSAERTWTLIAGP